MNLHNKHEILQLALEVNTFLDKLFELSDYNRDDFNIILNENGNKGKSLYLRIISKKHNYDYIAYKFDRSKVVEHYVELCREFFGNKKDPLEGALPYFHSGGVLNLDFVEKWDEVKQNTESYMNLMNSWVGDAYRKIQDMEPCNDDEVKFISKAFGLMRDNDAKFHKQGKTLLRFCRKNENLKDIYNFDQFDEKTIQKIIVEIWNEYSDIPNCHNHSLWDVIHELVFMKKIENTFLLSELTRKILILRMLFIDKKYPKSKFMFDGGEFDLRGCMFGEEHLHFSYTVGDQGPRTYLCVDPCGKEKDIRDAIDTVRKIR